MSTQMEQVRQTDVKGHSGIRARAKVDLTQILAQRDRLPWLWFLVAVGTVLFSGYDRWRLVESFKTRERVVIIDPAGTYYLSPLLRFTEAKELHAQQASLATIAFLERNPAQFDHPDLLKQVFLKEAYEEAMNLWQKEAAEFKAKELHQKGEIGKIDILATRENEVLARVSGQVIRNGVFQERAFTEAFGFSLRLRLVRNPNMSANGRFPTAVAEFKYEALP